MAKAGGCCRPSLLMRSTTTRYIQDTIIRVYRQLVKRGKGNETSVLLLPSEENNLVGARISFGVSTVHNLRVDVLTRVLSQTVPH